MVSYHCKTPDSCVLYLGGSSRPEPVVLVTISVQVEMVDLFTKFLRLLEVYLIVVHLFSLRVYLIDLSFVLVYAQFPNAPRKLYLLPGVQYMIGYLQIVVLQYRHVLLVRNIVLWVPFFELLIEL